MTDSGIPKKPVVFDYPKAISKFEFIIIPPTGKYVLAEKRIQLFFSQTEQSRTHATKGQPA